MSTETNYFDDQSSTYRFDLFENLSDDSIDLGRRTVYKICDVELHDTEFFHWTYEVIDLKKMLSLKKYAEYELLKSKHSGDNESCDKESLNSLLKTTISILNSKQNRTFFLTPTHLYNQVIYMPSNTMKIVDKEYLELGRLYCKSGSIQTMPKQVRHFVLGGDGYRDYDIVNSHPSILLIYAQQEGLEVRYLKEYVDNRSVYLSRIISENSHISTDEDAKKFILVMLNSVEKNLTKVLESRDNHMTRGFFSDVKVIRESLWNKLNNTQPYSIAIERLSKQESNRDLKVYLQAIYCATQETIHLKKFMGFLQNCYDNYLDELDDYGKSNSMPRFANRFIESKPGSFLTMVPFFDGVMVKSHNHAFARDIPDLVEEFNASETLVLKQKSLEQSGFTYVNVDLLEKVHNITCMLNSLSNSELKIFENTFNYSLYTELVRESKTDEEIRKVLEVRELNLFSRILAADLQPNEDFSRLLEKLNDTK